MQTEVCLLPYLVLLQAGFTVPRHVTSRAVRSYRTFSPLPARSARLGGLFSVALSMGSRPPGVTWRPARWSPDFPPKSPRKATRRLSGRLLLSRADHFTTTGFDRGGSLPGTCCELEWCASGVSHEGVCPSEGDMPDAYHQPVQAAQYAGPSSPAASRISQVEIIGKTLKRRRNINRNPDISPATSISSGSDENGAWSSMRAGTTSR